MNDLNGWMDEVLYGYINRCNNRDGWTDRQNKWQNGCMKMTKCWMIDKWMNNGQIHK